MAPYLGVQAVELVDALDGLDRLVPVALALVEAAPGVVELALPRGDQVAAHSGAVVLHVHGGELLGDELGGQALALGVLALVRHVVAHEGLVDTLGRVRRRVHHRLVLAAHLDERVGHPLGELVVLARPAQVADRVVNLAAPLQRERHQLVVLEVELGLARL